MINKSFDISATYGFGWRLAKSIAVEDLYRHLPGIAFAAGISTGADALRLRRVNDLAVRGRFDKPAGPGKIDLFGGRYGDAVMSAAGAFSTGSILLEKRDGGDVGQG